MDEIRDLIGRINSGDNVNAEKSFNTIISNKVATALNTKKIEVASLVYNSATGYDSLDSLSDEPVAGSQTEV